MLQEPTEVLKWESAAEQADVSFEKWEIEAPHVAFAQMPRANCKIMSQALPGFFARQ